MQRQEDLYPQGVWLSALLHDIGKFQQRAEWGSYISHQEYGARWCEQPFFPQPWRKELTEAVRQHHNRNFSSPDAQLTRLCQLVQLADNLAAGERTTGAHPQTTPNQSPLMSVFSRIPLQWKEGKHTSYPTEQYYAVQSLNWESDTLLPISPPAVNQSDYQELWKAFQQEWQAFTNGRTYHEADFRTILALLEKYTSFIPSDAPWEPHDEPTPPDVSLYDHLRVTSALAACLDKQLDSQALEQAWSSPQAYDAPLLLLVKGDLSGIQAFLYLTGRGGVASGLKGRSAFLQLLTEAIADFILRNLNLPPVCSLVVSGGHFYLLVPHKRESDLQRLRRQISQKLLQAFQGDLRLLLEWVPLTTSDLLRSTAISSKWDLLAQKVGERKLRLWDELPDADFQQLFTPVQRATDTLSLCQVCYGEYVGGRIDNGVRKCGRCLSFEELGKAMRYPDALVIEQIEPQPIPPNATWDEVLCAFGWNLHIVKAEQSLPTPLKTPVLHLTFTPKNFIPDNRTQGWSYSFRPLATATPSPIGDRMPDFEELAENGEGAPWLGVLRMDVDSLGGLFAKGLQSGATLSRMATLSRTIRLFFEGYVAHLCKPYADNQQLYLLYAGGDDLFLVGAWSVLPELAHTIRERFRHLVGGDHITLSAGIAIDDAKAPLYRLAESARVALDDQAKQHQWHQNGQPREKDSIGFLQTPMGWGEFERVRAAFEQVCQMVQGGSDTPSLPRSFITRLASIASLYQRNVAWVRRNLRQQGGIAPQRVQDLTFYARWLWRSRYHLTRFSERHKAHKDAIEQIYQQLAQPQNSLIPHLHVVARWAELYTRKSE